MTGITTRPRLQYRIRAWLAGAGLVGLALTVGFVGGRATISASGQPELKVTTGPLTVGPSPAAVASYSPVVDRVAPAVVTVRVEKQAEGSRMVFPDSLRNFFGPGFQPDQGPRRESGLGSGIIYRSDGHILTNNHVISGATKIRVDLADGRSFPATLVGTDEASDLAVLKIATTDLPTVAFGDSDRMKVGDVVLAFGNPLGVGQTVTMGIVSAKGRATGLGDGNYEDFLQTDAAINQGNSGGALVNLQGELVGINAQILSPTGGNIGLGFAIPSAMARAVSDQLMTDGVVHRSKLGVTVQGVTAELAESLGLKEAKGALVGSVEPGSPAARAGLETGDVIVGLDGRSVSDANALRNQIASMRPGTSVTLDVVRNGKNQSLSAKLVERDEPQQRASRASESNDDGATYGLNVSPVTPQLARSYNLPSGQSGLVVTDIDPDGSAASAGVRAGDVITKVNGREVRSASDLRSALTAHTDRPALLLVNRNGANVFVALPHEQS